MKAQCGPRTKIVAHPWLTLNFYAVSSTPGVGNYFHSRAILGLYMCLAGQIQVKYANSNLKNRPSWAVCCPFLLYTVCQCVKSTCAKAVQRTLMKLTPCFAMSSKRFRDSNAFFCIVVFFIVFKMFIRLEKDPPFGSRLLSGSGDESLLESSSIEICSFMYRL